MLPFQNVHESIVQIINSAAQYRPAMGPGTNYSTSSAEEHLRMTEEALVGLLITLWRKIRDDPSQLLFFYVPLDDNGHPSLNIASSLLPIVLKAGKVGEQARQATLLAATSRGGLAASFFIHYSPFFSDILNVLGSQVHAFLQGKGDAHGENIDLDELLRFMSALTSEDSYRIQSGSNGGGLWSKIHKSLAGAQDSSHEVALSLTVGLKRILHKYVRPVILQNDDEDCLVAGVTLMHRMLSIFMDGNVYENKKTCCLCDVVLSFMGSGVKERVRDALLR